MSVLVLVEHRMETGERKDRAVGKSTPAHSIETMTFALNGKVVSEASLGPGVSPNPLTAITLSGAKPGDQVKVGWENNQGQRGAAQATIVNTA